MAVSVSRFGSLFLKTIRNSEIVSLKKEDSAVDVSAIEAEIVVTSITVLILPISLPLRLSLLMPTKMLSRLTVRKENNNVTT
jgi:hypothetical protein